MPAKTIFVPGTLAFGSLRYAVRLDSSHGDAGILVGVRIAISGYRTGFSADDTVELWTNSVFCSLTDLVAGLAGGKDLFTLSWILTAGRVH